jgi:enoyl-CoA hydratase
VIRAAKESLNGIDLWDVRRSYRYEQGFTFELNLSGVADKVRDEFGKEG